MIIKLKYIQPYSFDYTFRRLRNFEKMVYVHQDNVFLRTIHEESRPLVLRISHNEKEKCIHIEIQGELSRNECTSASLRKILTRMFSTEIDLGPFYEQFDSEDSLLALIEKRRGMHLVTEPSLYECLIKTIISQQLNVSFAATLIQRLIDIAGDKIEVDEGRLNVFPLPTSVARLEYEDLQRLQFNRRKAEYLIDISRKITEGRLNLEVLRQQTDEEVFDTLLPLRGVGRWTVECLLIFGLGRPNRLPADDIGLRNALRKVYQLPEQPSEEMVREIAKNWPPYASYITFCLWDSLSE